MSSVDVVVPCYNYAHFLTACVESVLAQPVDVRVLIIDDASPDNTADVARTLQERDSRVSFIRHAVNRGHIDTYNEGLLSWTRGDYLLLLSADDLLTPGALARAASFLDNEKTAGYVFGRPVSFKGNELSSVTDPGSTFDSRVLEYDQFLRAACELGSTEIQSPTVVVRSALQKRVGGYRKDLPHSGDTEMWLRLAAIAPVGFINTDQAFKRKHETNMSENYSTAWCYAQQKMAFDVHFNENESKLHRLDELRSSLGRSIGEQAFWSANKAFERGDLETSKSLLAFAEQTYPALQHYPPRLLFTLKQAIGTKNWSRIRRLVGTVNAKPCKLGIV